MRLIVGSLVAAILIFVWGFLAWAALNLHGSAYGAPNDEAALAAELVRAMPESGAYVIPSEPAHTDGMTDVEKEEAQADWVARSKAGPVAMMFVQADGADPEDPKPMAIGFAITFASTLLAGILLTVAGIRSTAGRVIFVIMLGAFTVLVADGSYWNWFGFGTTWTTHMALDRMVGWVLAGIALGIIVKPKSAPAGG